MRTPSDPARAVLDAARASFGVAREMAAVTLAVLRRPDLWSTAARQIRALARPRWWRRAPFLPVPPAGYLRFRLETAYGGNGRGPVRAADVVTYLEWCRTWRHL